MEIEWSTLSNAEIRMKMESMKMEYEAIKNKINFYVDKLDELDKNYNNASKELNKRSK